MGATVLLSRAFIATNPQLAAGRPRIHEISAWDDPVDSFSSRWREFHFMGDKMEEVRGDFQVGRSGIEGSAGLVGAGFFERATLIVDHPAGKAWVRWQPPQPLEDYLRRLNDPRNKSASPLHRAARMSRQDAVKALLERGVDPNVRDSIGMTALMISAARGDTEATAALLSHGAKHDIRSDARQYAALSLAAQYGRVATAKMLLDAGADVNARTEHDRTPLFLAADADRPEMLEFLIGRGADVHYRMPSGESALFAACRNASESCVAILLKHGAKPDVQGRRGTPLTYAAAAGSLPVVKLLLRHGANVNLASRWGLSPAAAATASYRGVDCLTALLDAGADPNAKDASGRSVLDHAVAAGSAEAIRLLRATGAVEQ